MLDALKRRLLPEWNKGAFRSNDWAGKIVADLKPAALLDIGCGDGAKLFKYLKHKPEKFCGVEAAPPQIAEAEKRGIKISAYDLNGKWPYPDQSFDVIHCAYLIEHLHNTRLFAMEAFRVLKPGGTAVITSENLCSFLNLGAMVLGYTPFTIANCCGWTVGNPFGLYPDLEAPQYVPMDDPAFSGVTGHVRALSVPQGKDIFDRVGFVTESTSIGLLPLPDRISQAFEGMFPRRGHFLMIKAVKPK
ncbi:MAG TPA: class I SAM-dependent methyltransferase [Verrucomicrobiae bacterium]|nr:class I SAM-dependent methyltransferase [Verrucomicrobiae bacterium]